MKFKLLVVHCWYFFFSIENYLQVTIQTFQQDALIVICDEFVQNTRWY